MRKSMFITTALLSSCLSFPLWAGTPSPVGRWMTVDDVSHKPKSVIQISQQGGTLSGTVVKIFKENSSVPSGLCEQCTGAKKNKPILGMTILWGLKPSGNLAWNGGEILDPKNGKVYDAKATLSADGKTLQMRGFLGVSMFGRTQTWVRQ